VDADAYCREIEAHLCRKNAGHLVRVVGPAFEMVAGWAARGIPLKVACRGIDRTVERRAAKGPARRPLRVEFCEADVLDAFEEWRRAVGVGTAGGGAIRRPGGPGAEDGEREAERPKSGPSLRAHLDRVATRLTDRLADGSLPAPLEAIVERAMAEIGEARASSRHARGEARAALVERLRAIDDEVMAGAWAATAEDVRDALRREAEQDVVAFRSRMPADDYARAVEAGASRLLRDRLKLPDIAYHA
jgi:hypothetical protein